jgi:predicted HAD superfamily Cof-like phosphohydrolase
MNHYLTNVAEFSGAFDVSVTNLIKGEFDEAVIESRLRLIDEEIAELKEALAEKDTIKALDALADIQYVLSWAVLCFGFEKVFDSAFEEVHFSNMTKFWGEESSAASVKNNRGWSRRYTENGYVVKNAEGKVVKPSGYSKPELSHLV